VAQRAAVDAVDGLVLLAQALELGGAALGELLVGVGVVGGVVGWCDDEG